MKLISPLPRRRGRIEIIPLIDIMFFLLAAFMIVSINKIRVKSLKVNLPTNVASAQPEKKEDFISLSVGATGQIQMNKEEISNVDALFPRLQELYAKNKEQKFLISADTEARHGDVVKVLGKLRAAGFQKIAFSVKPDNAFAGSPAAPVSPTSPVPATSPAPTTSTEPETSPASTTPPVLAPVTAPAPNLSPSPPTTPSPPASPSPAGTTP